MKCRHFFSFVLVLFLSFFFGSFIITNDTFAVSDLSVTYSSGSTISNWQDIFPDCNYSCLSQYSYLSISVDSFNRSLNPDIRYNFDGSFSGSFSYRNTTSFYILYLPLSSSSSYLRFSNSPTDTFSNSVTFTLMESYSSLPSGNIDITSNGTYDVTNYATATVDVPAEVIQGDYHDDLVNIQNAIITCGAILLVLYFFYCIYRLIIKNSGVH